MSDLARSSQLAARRATPGRDGFLTINGLRHHYLKWGPEGADPLVLLHGLMNNARYWEHIASAFGDRYEVFAPDLRGHGETEHAPGGYLVWAFAMDLAGFVQQMDFEAMDLVAHSIGSRVAMAYARDHSHRIRHLVLADMGPEMAQQGARGIRRSVADAGGSSGFPTESEALTYYEQLYPGRDRDFLMRQVAAGLALDEVTGNLVFRFDPKLHEATGRGALAEIPFLWESLEHVTCPTLVIRAEKSRVLSREIARSMVERLPNAHLVEIPDCGHQIPLHQPERFVGAVREFLAS